MITKAERRIVAIVMAAMTCTATVSTTGLAVYAEDNPASVERVESGKQYETTVESAKNIQKSRRKRREHIASTRPEMKIPTVMSMMQIRI